jgi:hypothetical protein
MIYAPNVGRAMSRNSRATTPHAGIISTRTAISGMQLENIHGEPKQGSMNTAVVRAGIVNVPVLLANFAVLTTGSCENACTGCSTSF